MNIVPALEWVESTELSTAIREGALLYPIITSMPPKSAMASK
jgi:hypothetical protein